MEKKIVDNKIHTTIFCSPHNPSGRVWERWEIEKAMEIYEKHDVYVIADEIWSDIILGDHKHIPTQSVSEYAKMHTAAFYAPSKTFNLAGLIVKETIGVGVNEKAVLRFYQTALSFTSISIFPW